MTNNTYFWYDYVFRRTLQIEKKPTTDFKFIVIKKILAMVAELISN